MTDAAPGTSMSQVQARFFTKQERYAVPDNTFSIPAMIGVDDLSTLVNGLLRESQADWENVDFDFLVGGEFLRVSLQEHLEQKDISTESVVDIEYVERLPAPEPQDSLNHDDWVSAVHTLNEWILTGCYDNTVHLWNVDGTHRLTIPGHSGPVKGVTWVSYEDPFATFASVSHDQTVMLWKLDLKSESVECIHIGRGHERSVECVAVDSSLSYLATGGWDTYVKIWAASTDEDKMDEGQEKEASKKKAKSDGKSLTRTPLMTLPGHKEAISSAVWIETNEVCTASWDHTIKIWDAELGGLKTELVGNKSFFSVSFSPVNRTLVTASADRHVRLYDPRSQEGSVVKGTFTSHSGWVSSVRWSQTDPNLFVSGGHDQLLKLWDCRSPKAPLYDMTGHEDKILCCDWSNPELMVSGSADNTVKVFSSKSGGA